MGWQAKKQSPVHGYLIAQGLILPIGKEMMNYLLKCAATNDIHIGRNIKLDLFFIQQKNKF